MGLETYYEGLSHADRESLRKIGLDYTAKVKKIDPENENAGADTYVLDRDTATKIVEAGLLDKDRAADFLTEMYKIAAAKSPST
jgi:hypothetical protein